MGRAYLSEWLKIRRLSVLTGAIAMLGFTLLGVFLTLSRWDRQRNAFLVHGRLVASDGLVYILSHIADLVAVIALVTVCAAVAAEWSQGTLRNLLIHQPGRLRLLAGKFLALLSYVLLAAAVSLAIGSALAFAIAPGYDVQTSGWSSTEGLIALRDLAGNLAIAIVGWSIFGTLVAVVTRSAAAAVGITIGWLLVVEGLFSVVWPDVGRWLPGRLLNSLLNGGDHDGAVGYQSALWWSLAYATVFVAVSAVVFRRRDVTA